MARSHENPFGPSVGGAALNVLSAAHHTNSLVCSNLLWFCQFSKVKEVLLNQPVSTLLKPHGIDSARLE